MTRLEERMLDLLKRFVPTRKQRDEWVGTLDPYYICDPDPYPSYCIFCHKGSDGHTEDCPIAETWKLFEELGE